MSDVSQDSSSTSCFGKESHPSVVNHACHVVWSLVSSFTVVKNDDSVSDAN